MYAVSVIVSLSPVGELVLCVLAGATPLVRTDMMLRLEPVLDVVYEKAQAHTSGLPKNVHLRLIHEQAPNAFAMGRRTICVTEGVFALSDSALLGLMAHEVGHLARRHSDVQLVIGGANVFITGFILLLKGLSLVIAAICGVGTVVSIFKRSGVIAFILGVVGVISVAVVGLWVRLCTVFLIWTMRSNEFAADKYAAEIGFGSELALVLDTIDTSTPSNGLLRALYATHPNVHDRVGALQNMGVPYSQY